MLIVIHNAMRYVPPQNHAQGMETAQSGRYLSLEWVCQVNEMEYRESIRMKPHSRTCLLQLFLSVGILISRTKTENSGI